MPYRFLLCSVLLFFGLIFLNGQEAGQVAGSAESRGWVLTFVDEFDGERLDYDKWIPKDPWGVERNDELQGYWIKAFHPENGILKIRCEKEDAFYDGKKREYRSGMMATNRTFNQQFGRLEIRCRIPKGQGLWPAFWLLPESMGWPPEIDVLEIISEEPHKLHMTNHWPKPSNPTEESDYNSAHFNGPDFSEEFHVFTVEWETDEIRWYVDGVQRHASKEGIPQEPMYMLINLAVGGWAKAPDESTVFPADFEVDYVKVWKR